MTRKSDRGATPTAHRPLSEVDAGDPKPVLFLHIPKTAGTSFLLMLQNTFGDHNVRRIREVDEQIRERIGRIVDSEMSGLACLAGHLPIHLFDGVLERFQPFTVLREPVARVLSLYRFFRSGDPAVPRRLGLRPDFSLAEFLNWGHPEVYSQVNNGMVRMLCGNPALSHPGGTLLFDIGGQIGTLQQAVANLDRMDFGLTEALPATLALAQERWGIPYELTEYRENAGIGDATAEEVVHVHRIVAQNMADLALYHQAKAIFRARPVPKALRDKTPPDDWNPSSVFTPVMNRETDIGQIAGRRGFHEFESDGLSWLHAEQPADIHCLLHHDLVRLRLRLYCVIPDYPVAGIAISVNGRRLRIDFCFDGDKWCWLETEHFETKEGLNRILIQAPLFISMAQLASDSQDKRALGVALAHLQIGP